MVNVAILKVLDSLNSGIKFDLEFDGRFLLANGVKVDLSGFRAEEMAQFNGVEEGRQLHLAQAIVSMLGWMTTNAVEAPQTVVETPVVAPVEEVVPTPIKGEVVAVAPVAEVVEPVAVTEEVTTSTKKK
jgi:hypothetical protein